MLGGQGVQLGILAADLGHQGSSALGVTLGQQVVVLLLHGDEGVLDLLEAVVDLHHLLPRAALLQLGLQLLTARTLFFQELLVAVYRDELPLAGLRGAGALRTCGRGFLWVFDDFAEL